MADTRTLSELVEEMNKEGRAFSSYLDSQSHPQPSFNPDKFKGYAQLSPEGAESQRKLREAAKALYDLTTGPAQYITDYSWSYTDNANLRFLLHFGIDQAVPLTGSVPYSQVAKTCNVDESYVRRILGYAVSSRLFYEPEPGHIAHNSCSALLVTDPILRDTAYFFVEDCFPYAANIVEAYQKWGASEEPTHTAFNYASNTDILYFKFIGQPGFEKRMARFSKTMSGILATPAWDIKYTVTGYDWASAKGTIVDIGGSEGAVAIALARAYRNLPHIIVEDLPHVAARGQSALPSDLQSRISFHGHDFYTPQSDWILSGKLFVLRFIMHDHSDKAARTILEHILPALKNGAVMVVADGILPAPGVIPWSLERGQRSMDMEMMSSLNGKERQIGDWDALFKSVDPKLKISKVNQPEGSALSLMEVVMDS